MAQKISDCLLCIKRNRQLRASQQHHSNERISNEQCSASDTSIEIWLNMIGLLTVYQTNRTTEGSSSITQGNSESRAHLQQLTAVHDEGRPARDHEQVSLK